MARERRSSIHLPGWIVVLARLVVLSVFLLNGPLVDLIGTCDDQGQGCDGKDDRSCHCPAGCHCCASHSVPDAVPAPAPEPPPAMFAWLDEPMSTPIVDPHLADLFDEVSKVPKPLLG